MKGWRKYIVLLIDTFLVNAAFLMSISIIYQEERFTEITSIYTQDCLVVSLIFILAFYISKLYESLWDVTGTDEFLIAVGGCMSAGILSIIYTRFIGSVIPIKVHVLATVLTAVFVLGYRVLYRVYRRSMLYLPYKYSKDQIRVMIVGAGSAGAMIINEMMARRELKYNPVALIDDDPYKKGKRLSGLKICGNRNDIKNVAIDKEVDLILIAIPSISNKDKKEIIEICKSTNCKMKIIPGIYEILNGDATVSKIKDVEVEDLLGRDPIMLDTKEISEYLTGKNVLVTGGGGSIGSELCRQIANFNPNKIVIFDIYENSVYDLKNELNYAYPKLNLEVLIGSVRDTKRLKEIFKSEDINVVFHAAAHKHVPLMEDSPKEAIKNNVFGTLNTAIEASIAGVDRFVLISTDKAVNPTNIMGATKRLCEMVIQALNTESKTEFVAVRFGNVLGSNGSVIPLFKKQIANGGPITVTHKDITRFFMTIPEASQLVLQAGAIAKGGEIFVLDMGKPVRIYDLAVDLVKLSGLEPGKDIKIEITGLRPGEKLYEELLMSEEGLKDTRHKKIFVGKPTFENMDTLQKKLKELELLLEENENENVREKMQDIVPTYRYKRECEVAISEEKNRE